MVLILPLHCLHDILEESALDFLLYCFVFETESLYEVLAALELDP